MTTVCRAAQSILDQATELWPNRNRASDGTIGDASHSSRTSDHNPDSRGIVHAADLTHDPAHGCDAHAQADAIRLRARAGQEPRLKYVISNRRIASPTADWAWRSYSGSNPHDHHAHFSVNSGSIENDGSPWFTGQSGGLTVADIEELIKVIKAQGELTRKKIEASSEKVITAVQNQGKLTREKIEAQG